MNNISGPVFDAVPGRGPGHYKEGADTNHFLGRCPECDAHYVAGMNRGQVEDWYRQGVVGQDMFEAYMHVWATGAVRYGTDSSDWVQKPTNPTVVELVEAIQAAYLRRGR